MERMRTPLLTSLDPLVVVHDGLRAGRCRAGAAPPPPRRRQPRRRRRRPPAPPVVGPPPSAPQSPAPGRRPAAGSTGHRHAGGAEPSPPIRRSACSDLPRRTPIPTARSAAQYGVAVADVPRPAVAVHASLTAAQRFVIGLSGWGWIDTAYQKFGPWGDGPDTLDAGPDQVLEAAGPHAAPGHADLAFDGSTSSRGRSSWSAPAIRRSPSRRRRRGHRRSLAARRQVEPVGLPGRPLRGLGGVSPGHGPGLQHVRAHGRSRAGRVDLPIAFYGLTDNQFRPAGAGRQRRDPLLPAAVSCASSCSAWPAASAGHVYGTRPVAILDFGWVKLKVGIEYQHDRSTSRRRPDRRQVQRRRRRRPVRLRAPRRVRAERRAGNGLEHRRHRVA